MKRQRTEAEIEEQGREFAARRKRKRGWCRNPDCHKRFRGLRAQLFCSDRCRQIVRRAKTKADAAAALVSRSVLGGDL